MPMTNAVLSRQNRLLKAWRTEAQETLKLAQDEIIKLRKKISEMEYIISLLIEAKEDK
jgi:hypothetical protein